VTALKESSIESRPLICGSISRQPFWYTRYGKSAFKNADVVHDFGLYVPNNPDMTAEEVEGVASLICSVNQVE
jgi:CDP-6-deoxy-D-xylo-4-hexulose-3-dehydrase